MTQENQHDLWFKVLTQEHKVTIWDQELILTDFVTSQSMGYSKRDFELDHQRLRDLKFKDGDIIVDLGANIGMLSILLAKKFPKTIIYAVECMEHNLIHLRHNVEVNKVENIRVVPIAVSMKEEEITIYQHPLNSGSASRFLGNGIYPGFRVHATTLDKLLEFIPRIALLKIDIEGDEHEALKVFTGWDKIERLVIELHDIAGKPWQYNKVVIEETRALIKEKMGEWAVVVYE